MYNKSSPHLFLTRTVFFFLALLPAVYLPLPFAVRLCIAMFIAYVPVWGSLVSIAVWIWAAAILLAKPFDYLTVAFVLIGIGGIFLNIHALLPTIKKLLGKEPAAEESADAKKKP